MIIQHSRGQPCEVRPSHHGGVHLSDLMRADIEREFGKREVVVKVGFWKRIWG